MGVSSNFLFLIGNFVIEDTLADGPLLNQIAMFKDHTFVRSSYYILFVHLKPFLSL
jgi:hypothetical protein